MEQFADFLHRVSLRNGSYICAGFDPVIEDLPQFILDASEKQAKSTDDFIYAALTTHFRLALTTLSGAIAAIKPNLAFFEQYGLAGLRSLQYLCDLARASSLPVIADAKRGDIGSTAAAYGRAFLAERSVCGKPFKAFLADALTVSPFLGFETLQPFLEQCRGSGRGLFVLVRTSNVGADDLQSADVSRKIAAWIESNAAEFTGVNGWSGLGAVVGATNSAMLKQLRGTMAKAYFLVPGMGAQGAGAADVAPAFGKAKDGSSCGALVNISRGLFANLPENLADESQFQDLLLARITEFNRQIKSAIAAA